MQVAAVQLNSTPDLDHNLSRARALIAEAASQGAQLIALPEHFAYLGPEDVKPPSAQPLDGPLVSEFRELARKLGVFLLLGSFPEVIPGDTRPHNTSVLLSSQGEILAAYRKMHLFDVDIVQGPRYRESQFTQAGTDLAVESLPGTPFTAGLAICYDLRFPELFRALSDRGADLLLLPAAFTLATGRDHWEVLIRARAIENQAYLIAPAQWGQHSPGRRSYGRSLIVDPWGLILAQAPDGEGIIYAHLDHDRLKRLRRELPCLDHRRLK
ncbi:MAG: carbon-nitrogen hydrolase family protein [Syntrophales bacterium]|nr:carbon-nitrogen hydrolase family protein [Syntrophales bacterium]MDD5641305.1 carbon-nitrogen hydrolase family protein [Syntrophales bacterium]